MFKKIFHSIIFLSLFAIMGMLPVFAQESATCEEGSHLFEHEYLGSDPVCIPDAPERVAVLDLSPLEVVLIQGIKPVAIYSYGRDLIARSNPDINIDVMALTEDAVDVGNAGEVNLEALLESAPDLIIASEYTATSAGIDVLQQIAPTVIFKYPVEQSEYRASVEFVSAVLNTPEAGDAILAQLDSRLANFQEVMGDQLATTEISLVRLRETLVLFIAGSFGDHLIHEAGLIRPEQQQQYDVEFVENQNDGWVGFDVSEENLPLLDGEYVFIWTASPSAEVEAEAQGILSTLLENPLWSTLKAVQNDHLFIVGSHWQGFGIFEAHTALDDLFQHIAGVDPQEASPNPFLVTDGSVDASTSVTFPLTITHNLGTIEIPARPERVIALGISDIANVYALGITPVAISSNPYAADGQWPWLEGQYDPEQTQLLPFTNPSFEEIVELQPDIILGVGLYNLADLYPNLSEIAPTLAGTNTSIAITWQEQTHLVSQALGLDVAAQAVIDETEQQIASVIADHPEIAGKTFSLSYLHSVDALGSINSSNDFAVQFFESLGFVVTPPLAELAKTQQGVQAALSLETLNMIDADLVVLAFGSPEIQASYEANPIYQQLKAVQEGRVVVVDLNVVTQLRSPNVLGIRWVLDQLEPSFAVLK